MNQEEIWNLCKLTFVLTLIMATAVYATHSPREISGLAANTKDRKPSNLNSQPSILVIPQATTETPSSPVVDLNCLGGEKVRRLKTETQQIRVVGKDCGKAEGFADIFIENSTNGFEASIFRENRSFSSDYVSLKRGTNAIRVSYRDNDGVVLLTELIVQRSY